jgi:hypothetical protein
VVVSDFRSLRGDIAFRPLLARQSPAAKIPFQTRRGEKVRNVAAPSANVGIRICLQPLRASASKRGSQQKAQRPQSVVADFCNKIGQ